MATIDIGVGDPKRPYRPVSDTVKAFHDSPARMRLLVGPFGSGKSVAAVFELLRNSTLSKNTKYVIVRDSYRNLQDTCIWTFFSCIPEAAGQWQKSELIFTMPSAAGGTIEFMFRSAETRPEDVSKFRGLEISGFWLGAFEGDTGPYLQYSLVRARKILQKVNARPTLAVDFNLLKTNEEGNLIKQISNFKEIVAKAAEQYAPYLVAQLRI